MIHMKLTTEGAASYYVAEVDSIILDSAAEKFWYGKLSKVSPMELRTDKLYGGMLRVSGNARFSVAPDATEWPIPLKLVADIRNYDPRNQSVTNLFVATAHLSKVHRLKASTPFIIKNTIL